MRRGNLEIHDFFTAKEILDFKVDLSKLEHVRDMKIFIMGVSLSSSIDERLRKRIQRRARDADVAVVTLKQNYSGAYFDYRGYVCSLYKYRK